MTAEAAGGTFRAAHASGGEWDVIARALADGLAADGAAPDSGGLGFLYVTEELGGDAGSVLAVLREATGVADWAGAVGFGIAATGTEYFGVPAAVAMIAPLGPGQFRLLGTVREDNPGALAAAGAFPGATAEAGVPIAVVHGDAANPAIADIVAGLADESAAFLVGGLTALRPRAQIAGAVTGGGLSGVLLAPGLGVATGLSQGCAPIGPLHTITDGRGNVLVELDRRPALDVLLEDIGPELAAHLEEVAYMVHAALPVPGSDRGDYLVRNLTGIDPRKRLLAIGETIDTGQTLTFCTRNRDTAITDLERMLDELRGRLGRPPRGGLYYSCVARGPNLFGPGSREMKALARALGDVPMAGFYANGEIFNRRLYGYTGVLVLFP